MRSSFFDAAGDLAGASKDARVEMARAADAAPARTRAAVDTTGTDLECLLDFALKLGEKMILCGANIERVNDTIQRVCESYHCREVHFFCA